MRNSSARDEQVRAIRLYCRHRTLRLRNQAVEAYIPLVRFLSAKFGRQLGLPGEPAEDIEQVGTIGLIKALERYDVSRGVEFGTYATHYILGEIRRYFRDKVLSIAFPRPLIELVYKVNKAELDLMTGQTVPPTASQIADYVGDTVEHVQDALRARRLFFLGSTDTTAPGSDGKDSCSFDDINGEEQQEIRQCVDYADLYYALTQLDEREQQYIRLHFFQNKDQKEVGRIVGCSQMQVSRIILRAAKKLRPILVSAQGGQ